MFNGTTDNTQDPAELVPCGIFPSMPLSPYFATAPTVSRFFWNTELYFGKNVQSKNSKFKRVAKKPIFFPLHMRADGLKKLRFVFNVQKVPIVTASHYCYQL